MRLLLVLFLLLLLPAVAVAQEPSPSPAPTAGIEDEAPGLDEDVDDPVDDEDPVEGDDAYTCGESGTEADYTYCATDAAPGGGAPVEKRKPEYSGTVQTLTTSTLPYTGTSPGTIALLGLALMMMGVGARMIASSSPAVRSRSSVTWR